MNDSLIAILTVLAVTAFLLVIGPFIWRAVTWWWDKWLP